MSTKYKYKDTHFRNIMCHLITGYPGPMLTDSPVWLKYLVYVYSGFISLLISLIAVLLITQLTGYASSNTLDNLVTDVIVLVSLSHILFTNIYYSLNIKKYDRMIDNFDRITEKCLNNPLDVDKQFEVVLKANHLFIKRYTFVVLYMFLAAVTYILPNALKSQAWFGLDGEKILSFEIWTPFDHLNSPSYEAVLFLEFFAVLICGTKKASHECILLSLMNLQKSFYRHLHSTMEEVMRSDLSVRHRRGNESQAEVKYNSKLNRLKLLKIDRNISTGKLSQLEREFRDLNGVASCLDPVEQKLKLWIQLHQEVNSLGNDMVHLFDPVVTSILLGTLVILTCSAFSITQDLTIDAFQIISLLAYFTNNFVSLFLLCLMGNILTVESQRVAEMGYWSSWFYCNNTIKTHLILIFQRVKIPLIIKAFRTTDFNLSNTTFVVFVKSIVSFYLALLQFKESKSKRNT